mgnify:FL=1
MEIEIENIDDTEEKYPVLIYGHNEESMDFLKSIDFAEVVSGRSMNIDELEFPYMDLYLWDDYYPKSISKFVRQVKSQNSMLNKSIIVCNDKKKIEKHHFMLFKELGIASIFCKDTNKADLLSYLNKEHQESGQIGSLYHYKTEIKNLLDEEDFERLGQLLRAYVVLDDEQKSKVVVSALLKLEHRIMRKLHQHLSYLQ